MVRLTLGRGHYSANALSITTAGNFSIYYFPGAFMLFINAGVRSPVDALYHPSTEYSSMSEQRNCGAAGPGIVAVIAG